MPEKKYLYGASVIIVEGIMALQSPEMRALYDLKVFVVRPLPIRHICTLSLMDRTVTPI